MNVLHVSLINFYKAQFKFTDDDDIPYMDVPYIAINEETKEVFAGKTDKEGLTQMFYSESPDDVKVHLRTGKYMAQFRFVDDNDVPYSFTDYVEMAFITKETFSGTTDGEGYTEIMRSSVEQEIKVHLLGVNDSEDNN